MNYCPQCGLPCERIGDHTCSPALCEAPYEMTRRGEVAALIAERDALKAALESTTRADDKIQNYAAAEIKLLRANVARLAANQPYTCESHKDEANQGGACHWCQLDALKAEVFQAKAIAEHWQKRTEQTEKERAKFRDDAKRLKEALEAARKAVNQARFQVFHDIVDAALAPKQVVPACEHNWIASWGGHVTGREICTKCKSFRPAQNQSSITNDIDDPSPDGM